MLVRYYGFLLYVMLLNHHRVASSLSCLIHLLSLLGYCTTSDHFHHFLENPAHTIGQRFSWWRSNREHWEEHPHLWPSPRDLLGLSWCTMAAARRPQFAGIPTRTIKRNRHRNPRTDPANIIGADQRCYRVFGCPRPQPQALICHRPSPTTPSYHPRQGLTKIRQGIDAM